MGPAGEQRLLAAPDQGLRDPVAGRRQPVLKSRRRRVDRRQSDLPMSSRDPPTAR